MRRHNLRVGWDTRLPEARHQFLLLKESSTMPKNATEHHRISLVARIM